MAGAAHADLTKVLKASQQKSYMALWAQRTWSAQGPAHEFKTPNAHAWLQDACAVHGRAPTCPQADVLAACKRHQTCAALLLSYAQACVAVELLPLRLLLAGTLGGSRLTIDVHLGEAQATHPQRLSAPARDRSVHGVRLSIISRRANVQDGVIIQRFIRAQKLTNALCAKKGFYP